MSDLYELIQRIKRRPAMYLGKPSINSLDAFLGGYILARRELGILQTEQEREFEGFQSWVQKKFHITSAQSWSSIILFYSQDERDALDSFFDLLEEFLRRDTRS